MMFWIGVINLGLLLAGIWLYMQGKRRVAYALIVGPILLVLVLFALSRLSDSWRGGAVALEEVQLSEPQMTPAPGAGYKFNARIHNNSQEQALGMLRLRIQALDCVPQSKESCEVIGQSDLDLHVRIPPGQARDTERTVVFGRSKPRAKGELRWQFTPLETRQ